jgi:hypothetical protein
MYWCVAYYAYRNSESTEKLPNKLTKKKPEAGAPDFSSYPKNKT